MSSTCSTSQPSWVSVRSLRSGTPLSASTSGVIHILLERAQVLMHKLHGDSAFSHGRSHTLYRTVPHIPNRKYSRDIGLEQVRVTIEIPISRTTAAGDN